MYTYSYHSASSSLTLGVARLVTVFPQSESYKGHLIANVGSLGIILRFSSLLFP